MTSLNLDKINTGLLVLSFGVAWILPFDGFLIAYAVLGPLHYLTEIQWLKKREFFVPQPWAWPVVFVLVAALLSYYPIAQLFGQMGRARGLLAPFVNHPEVWLLVLLLGAIGLVVVQKTSHRVLWFSVSFALAFALDLWMPTVAFWLKLMVPTLLHVYVFTLLFMLYGQRRSRHKQGWVNVGLMVLVPVVLFFLPLSVKPDGHAGATRFFATDLHQITVVLAQTFGNGLDGDRDVARALLQRAQIFVAFAYIYHYLNWFSKTSVIGWGKALGRRGAAVVVLLWLAAMAVYLWDFEVGLGALFFLSLTHVVLEFPLNVVTVKSLFTRSKT